MAQRILYHGTDGEELQKGSVLRPGGMPDFDVASPDIDMRYCGLAEEAFETGRPEDMISRREAVFLIDSPDPDLASRSGGRNEIMLQVMVDADEVERSDVHWWALVYDEVMQDEDADQKLIDDMVASYWNGLPSKKPVWEYRVRSATVYKVLSREENEQPEPDLSGGPKF